jgi:hypothetical protein
VTVLSAFIDPGHRETPAARALVKFSEQPVSQLESSLDGLASGGA